jgi:hypothetical protein
VTPVLPQTRLLLLAGTTLTAGTGAALVLFPDRTDDFWAWPIAAAPSAAFLGAGYVGAAVSLALAAREREWVNARLIALLAFVLTTTALLVTLRDLAPFELGTRGLEGVIAWTWLAVYVALPPLALAAFVRQERAGGGREYDSEPARAAIRLGAGATGLAVGLYGLGLLLDLAAFAARWPWPLTRLTAGVVGVWLLTYGIGFLWFALRDPNWRRIRIGAAGLGVALALHLLSAARLWGDFDGGAARAVYVGALVAVLAAIAAAAAAAGWVRRESRPGPGARAAAP